MTTRTLTVLNDWEREHGRCWVAEIEAMAKAGYTWADASTKFGLKGGQLKAFCHWRGFKFPWMNSASPLIKKRRVAHGQAPNLYQYRGKDMTLKELSGLSSLKITTIYCRIHRKGWTVERAVETPVTPLNVCAAMGGRASRQRNVENQRKPETDRSTHAPHGVHQ